MASRTIATILTMKDQFTNPAKKATSSIKNMQREMKKTTNSVCRFAKNAKKSFRNVAREASKMVKKTAKISTGMATIVGALATKTGFSEAFDMEGYKTMLETVTKDTKKASQLMVNSVRFANSTPFETKSVIEATAKMEAYGLNSTRWLKDIADMAGGMNKDIIQGTEAMADASVGEFERLKEFSITKDMIMAAASKKYGDQVVFNNKGQMLDQAKMMNVLQEMMQKKFKGGANKLSKTAKGLWSTVTGVTKNSLAKIVGMNEDGTIRQGSLYEKLKNKIRSVADTLQKWQNDGTIQRITKNVESAVSKITGALKFALEIVDNVRKGFGFWDGVAVPILEKIDDLLYDTFSDSTADMISNAFYTVFSTIDDIIDNAKKLFKFIKNNWDTIAPIILTIAGAVGAYKVAMLASTAYTKIATAVQLLHTSVLASGAATTNIMTIAQYALNTAFKANPIGFVITLITSLIAAGILLYKNWDTVKAKAGELWTGLKETFASVGNFFSGIFKSVKDAFFKVWDSITAGFKGYMNIYIKIINFLINGLNKVHFKIPDFIPKIGGKEFGINIPNIPTFAKGGIATQPSIFGEAGTEMAIPLKRNNPRSQMLLEKTDRIINGNKKGGINVYVTIQGNVIGNEEFANYLGNKIVGKVKAALDTM